MEKEVLGLKVEVNEKQAIRRAKKFYRELTKLCDRYGFMPSLAKDDETKDEYLVINLKDLISEKDIKISM